MAGVVFISFASKDRGVASTICEALENRGIGCWIATRDIGPGENFQHAVFNAIRSAKVMVLVFSSNSQNSDEVKKEIVLAGQCRLTVIPVRVEDVTPGRRARLRVGDPAVGRPVRRTAGALDPASRRDRPEGDRPAAGSAARHPSSRANWCPKYQMRRSSPTARGADQAVPLGARCPYRGIHGRSAREEKPFGGDRVDLERLAIVCVAVAVWALSGGLSSKSTHISNDNQSCCVSRGGR